MKRFTQILAISLMMIGLIACGSDDKKTDKAGEESPAMIKKNREDGTLSSVNPVDEEGFVHGVKTNYYEDGKTIHSRVTYVHGQKEGPALWYYKNGQIHEHTAFHLGKKHGLTKKYYKSGELLEEVIYDKGEAQPGAKKYNRQGEVID